MAEPVYGVMRRAAFLQALDVWAACERGAFDMSAPPVDAMSDRLGDENAELASTFFRLSRASTTKDRLQLLAFDILHHNRVYEREWELQRGNNDPRRVADRSGWIALRPYKEMIAVFEDWLGALRERLIEEEVDGRHVDGVRP